MAKVRGTLGLGKLVGIFLRKKNSNIDPKNSNKSNSDQPVVNNEILIFLKKNSTTFLSVLMFLLLFYFYIIGRDRYAVRSDVVVRKAGSQKTEFSLNSLLSGGNISSIEDARYLKTYLQSPQVLEDLEENFNYADAYQKKGLDFFAGLRKNPTREIKYRHFMQQISVQLDEVSGVLRINTLGFEPQIAYYFNNFLIEKAEKFVNELNQNVNKELLKFAKTQVDSSSKRLRDTNKKLLKFKENSKIINLEQEAAAKSSFISALESELIKLKVELATLQMQFIDMDAPEIKEVEYQINQLKNAINQERLSISNPNAQNLNKKLQKINDFQNELLFNQDLYKSALTAEESTRIDSLQQQRFMAILSKPLLPEEEWKYWRHKGFFTSIVILLVGYALTKFILGMADSHRN